LYAASGRLIPFNSNSPTGSTVTLQYRKLIGTLPFAGPSVMQLYPRAREAELARRGFVLPIYNPAL
jgi:hypothetical protein